ncbi:response regulator [Methylobacterium sp. Leaf456]|uniref:response regulator n=1 Tax=Methylobacterium sp. Leaf456 TaxID=1736382 RepID=UPI0009E6BD11|nr:response regulator [Methylobacterium sp. Leaf456]
MRNSKALQDRRILIVEDEYFIAQEMQSAVEEAGGIVIGPFADLKEVVSSGAYAKVDIAVLDINVKGESSFELADKLQWRGVPLCFATGYDADMLPDRFAQSRLMLKPFDGPELVKELTQVCEYGA